MSSHFAPTSVQTSEQKGEGSNQTHNQSVTQNKGSTTSESGRSNSTTHSGKTDTETSSAITTTSTGGKNDTKTDVVTEDAGFKMTFTIKIHGGLNAGGAAPALP